MRDFVFKLKNPTPEKLERLPEELILEFPAGKCCWDYLVVKEDEILLCTDIESVTIAERIPMPLGWKEKLRKI